ncbi:MAG: hypothetical protein A2150_07595 [Candidatus Muproteobacteria bacterium RBG_16_64_11]|uniref:Ribosomal RNA small subunit methyltransferase A n=1 Tax=Candidatus Muproteobacteria bacterium RBG_16_64_11 TaxID=1817758 RepID=A0A1F6TA07_9PROT|nr:MAG: hypothetical protein A2150_07595 [Candidatus Muproteobacteria bacterium RBG_16_64_11]
MSSLRPKKRFGQHFLRDLRVVECIVAAFAPRPADHVVEIGPGEGVLTRALVGRVARLDLVELDRDLAAQLAQTYAGAPGVTVHQADALKFDFRALARPGERLRLIGNLPYNISTPLLFHALEQLDGVREAATAPSMARGPRLDSGMESRAMQQGCGDYGLGPISDMLFMLQKEVVDRMAATPGGKDYGRLSVMLQWRARVEKLFDVPPGAFHPPPKVDSSVVRLTPHETPPVDVRDPQRFAAIVRAAFGQRRKVLRNTLKGLVTPETMERLGIEPGRRAETLSLGEFAALANTPG